MVFSYISCLDRPIAFHHVLTVITGRASTAVVLSQAIYWQLRCKDGRNGWWWKRDVDWKEETGMSRSELSTATSILTRSGVLDTQRKGMPAKKYYKVSISNLEKLINERKPGVPLSELMLRPVAYHRIFVDITGSVNAALLLSQGMYWQGRVPKGRGGWWWKTAKEWNNEVGLSRRELETARRKLRCLNIMEEKQEMLPSRVWYRVNKEVLNTLLSIELDRTDGYSSVFNIPPSEKKQEGENCANNRQFSTFRHPVSRKSPSQYTETTSDTTKNKPGSCAKNESSNRQRQQASPAGGERLSLIEVFGLICPSWVHTEIGENRVCKIFLRNKIQSEDVRRILAEFAAAKVKGICIKNPPAYLTALCYKVKNKSMETSKVGEDMSMDIRFG